MNAELCWRLMVVITVPFLLLPIFLLNDLPGTRWLYVVSIMAVFWITEVIPYSVTSLMPIGMFPLLDIMSTSNICKLYGHEVVFTFLASLMITSSIEACDLHKKIALKILCHVKYNHRRLHFTVMAISMFISMWMLNFIVIAAMSEICIIILEQLEVQEMTALYKPKPAEEADVLLRPTNIAMSYMLGISYAATIGGSGSLLGTPANLAFKGIFETYYSTEPEIDFFSFFLYCTPLVLINTLLTYLWLQFVFMGLLCPKSDDAAALLVTEEAAIAIKEKITQEYIKMGGFRAREIQVLILLVIYHIVLYTQPIWTTALRNKTIDDACPTVLFAILPFIMPSSWNCFKWCTKSSDDNRPVKSEPLLTWSFVRRNVPWGLIFVTGAGIALANSGYEFKIHDMIYQSIGRHITIPLLAISFIVCLICQIFTEFLSNSTAANIVLLFLAALLKENNFGGDAIDVMFPAALSLSMAFHTSIGTPGNAHVAALVNIPAKVVFYCGFGPSIITLLTIWGSYPLYGKVIYEEVRSNCTL